MDSSESGWAKPSERGLFLQELGILAQAVSADPRLKFGFGASNCGWYFDPGTKRIVGDPVDANRPLKSRTLLCHEAGHAAITRYQYFTGCPNFCLLLNALEDCRMEDWLANRFPGLGAPLWQVNRECLQESLPRCRAMPRAHQFGLGLIHDWFCGSLPDGLHPTVVSALCQTEQSRSAYTRVLPPSRYSVEPEIVRAYDASAVSEVFRDADRAVAPPLFERAVRICAHQAFVVARDYIWPVYQKLLEADNRGGSDSLARARESCSRAKPLFFPPPSRQRAKREARTKAAERVDVVCGSRDRILLGRSIAGLLEMGSSVKQPVIRLKPDQLDARYEAVRREVAPLVERLTAEVEQRLRLERRPLWRAGYRAGGRVNVNRAMAFEADPRQYAGLWEHLTVPSRVDAAILLLVDLSGSMSEDGKISHAFRGVVLLAEALDALGVRFAVHGFQDELIPFKRGSAPFDRTMRRRLAEMALEVSNQRPEGHNCNSFNDDGVCLKAAAQELLEAPHADRFLIVISDGQPAGRGGVEAASAQLKETVEWIRTCTDIRLIGLGLGPGTEHVQTFYPVARAGKPVEALPSEMAALLDPILAPRPENKESA